MTNLLRGIALAATLSCALMPAAFAQDAMATDAMAPATMTPITDAELATCLEQAATLTFPAVAYAATAACHGLHQGMDVMGAVRSMSENNAMATDAMSTDAMATDAMAPATK